MKRIYMVPLICLAVIMAAIFVTLPVKDPLIVPEPSVSPLPAKTPRPSVKIVQPSITSTPSYAPKIVTPQVSKAPQGQITALNGGTIFNLINAYRAQNGRTGFNVSDQLCKLAERRASYLISNDADTFRNVIGANLASHPGFQSMTDKAIEEGVVTATDISENLMKDARSEEGVVSAWKASSGHNALMLTSPRNNGCVATRVKEYGSITVLIVSD